MRKLVLFLFIYLGLSINAYGYDMLSIGDSIIEGYMLDNYEESFDNLFADTLNLDLTEYSEMGNNSTDILNLLYTKELDEDIKNADMIVLSVGSNDLLDIVFEIELPGIEIDFYNNAAIDITDSNFNIGTALIGLNDFFTSQELISKMDDAYIKFKNNWQEIIAYIKEINPDVKLIVNNLYNPFFNINVPLLDIDFSTASQLVDEYILKMNEVIENNSNGNYIVIDVYHILRNNKLLNLDLLRFELDPHPNQKGQKKIYEEYLKQLTYEVKVEDKVYYVIKGESLDLDEPYKEGYKFIKWDKDLNNISSNMEVKPIYKKNINYSFIILISIVVLLLTSIFIKRKKLLKK